METTQAIVGSSYIVFEPALRSLDDFDMSRFLLVARAIHPNLIPREVGCIIPKPVEPFVEGKRPLFLCASKVIQSKCDTLQLQELIQVLEVHDFSPPSDFDNNSQGSQD
jgi:hypothetical protein